MIFHVYSMSAKIAKFCSLILAILCLNACSSKSLMQNKINLINNDLSANLLFKEGIECRKPVSLNISGKIPTWLRGTFIRNGPGKFTIGDQTLIHWFDGFAFVVAFAFEDGRVTYQSAFLESNQLKDSLSSRKIKDRGFASSYQEGETYYLSKDGQKIRTFNPNINIEKIDNHFVALGETPLPLEFNPAALNETNIFDYDDNLKKSKIWESAHMKRDPASQVLYNFYIDYGLVTSNYLIYKINPNTTKRQLVAKYSVSKPSYMHDFSITEKYIILTAYPLIADVISLTNNANSFIGSHEWRPELGTIIYVFSKQNGKLIGQFKTDAMFAFHHINAYENHNGQIELFMTADINADIVLTIGNYPFIAKGPNLRKITIDIDNEIVTQKILSTDFYEMPKIRDDLVGKKNDVFYSILFSENTEHEGFGIAKYNLDSNQSLIWSKKGMFPSEPMFIPNPNGKAEDDGVIISIIYDHNQKKNFLLILDAKNMKELSRADIGRLLPFGLHGKFFTAK